MILAHPRTPTSGIKVMLLFGGNDENNILFLTKVSDVGDSHLNMRMLELECKQHID